MRGRKVMLAAMALLLPIGSAVAMGAGPAAARANGLGKGTYSCTKEAGTITFSPPLTFTAKVTKTTVKTTASGCKGGTPAVTAQASSSITTKSSSCTGLAGSTAFSITTTYTNGSTPSTLSGTAKGSTTNPVNFTITGKTTGSYASAKTTAKAVLNLTTTQLASECGSKGITTIKIVSGTITTE